jgi:hypothetical protein
MEFIALVHSFWLSLLPIGVGVALVGRTKRRGGHIAAGVVLIVFSIPAVLCCAEMWPADFLIPRTEMRLPVAVGAYTVTLVQKPGLDFYDSFFEVRRDTDGKITRVMIDADDDKWWRPRAIVQGTRTYFVRGSDGVTPRTSFVDSADGKLFSGYYGKSYHLGALGFEREWLTNGGAERN